MNKIERRNKKTKQVGNGNGSQYYSEAKGKLIFQYYDINNKRQTLTQRKKETNKQFNDRVTKVKSELLQGTYIERTNKTFKDILQEYIESKYKTNKVTARTHKRDLDTMNQIENVCKSIINRPIQKISIYHIKNVLPNMTQYSNSSIDKIYRLLEKVFKIATTERLIQFNPMDNESISKPKSSKETKKIEALTLDEHRKLVKVLEQEEHKYKYIILLQLNTGMRIGEVLALSTKDIDFGKNTITIRRTLTRDENDKTILGKTTKTKNSIRTIEINNKVKEILKKAQAQQITNINGLLFYDSKKDTFITPTEVNCYLKRLNNKWNIAENLHTHMLRHTFATRCIESNVQVKALQNMLGHKKIQTTLDIYTSAFKEFNENEFNKLTKYMQVQGL